MDIFKALILKSVESWVMVMQAFNLGTREAETGR